MRLQDVDQSILTNSVRDQQAPLAPNVPAIRGALDRLDLLRMPLIVLVVYIHSYAAIDLTHDNPDTTEFVAYVLSEQMARIAVPLFFLLSGYLFFRDGAVDFDRFTDKITSRIHTLLIPFLFWTTAIFIFVYTVEHIPSLAGFVSEPKTVGLDPFEILDRIVGWTGTPVAYQFWFIRDLIALVIIAPAIYWILRSTGPYLVVILGAVWFLGSWPFRIPSGEAMFFFTLGAYVGVARLNLFALDRYAFSQAALYVALLCFAIYGRDAWWGVYAKKLAIVVGVSFALALTRLAAKSDRLSAVLLLLAPASFFVFAVHEPTLTISRKLVGRVIGHGPISVFAQYLILPLAIIAIAIAAYLALTRLLPRPMRFVTGARARTAAVPRDKT